MNFFVFASLLSLLVCIYPMGGHIGNYMVYFFQLFAPFMVIVTLSGFDRMTHVLSGKQAFVLWIIAGLFLLNMLTIKQRPYMPRDVSEQLDNWITVEDHLKPYDRVLNAPPIVSILMKQKKSIYDSGMSEYFSYREEHSKVLGEKATRHISEWKSRIKSMVKNKQADVAVTVRGMPSFPKRNILSQHYAIESTIDVRMNIQGWKLEFWLPK